MSGRLIGVLGLGLLALMWALPAAAGGDQPGGIVIDGKFADWKGIASMRDARGDVDDRNNRYDPRVKLNNPDIDIVEWKFASDDQYLYVYVRVAGQVGRGGRGDRCYFMVHLDVDRNLRTGFETYIPFPRDSEKEFTDWYYPSNVGSDYAFEVEFREGKFSRTFITYWGPGDDKLGRWPYDGMVEFRTGMPEMAYAGSELEMRCTFGAFGGHVKVGSKMDVALSTESSGKQAGTGWCQDSTDAIRGFVVGRKQSK